MGYIPRLIDDRIKAYLDAFGAICIRGPKWCGKTTSAERHASSVIKLQDPDFSDGYKATAAVKPSLLLKGDNPRLIDEWQDIPQLWDAVRLDVDSRKTTGLYILTGSAVVSRKQKDLIHHSGTGRIAYLDMLPMTLYESGESNGAISLSGLFSKTDTGIDGITSDIPIEEIIAATCRGGWPESIGKSEQSQHLIVQQYVRGLAESDISRLTDTALNPETTRQVLRSYARNICTLSSKASMMDDIASVHGSISEPTFDKYVEALEELHIIADIPAWCPNIRSKSAIRAKRKRNLSDPSLAVGALGVRKEYFHTDLRSFGFLFESLAIRDLKEYSAALGGRISYYRDSYGLEADAVLHLEDGRYALIEFKLGTRGIEDGRKHLLQLKELIAKHNRTETQTPLREPDLLMVITATGMAYRDPSGVLIIPLTTLKP